jgi:hypothetical protein
MRSIRIVWINSWYICILIMLMLGGERFAGGGSNLPSSNCVTRCWRLVRQWINSCQGAYLSEVRHSCLRVASFFVNWGPPNVLRSRQFLFLWFENGFWPQEQIPELLVASGKFESKFNCTHSNLKKMIVLGPNYFIVLFYWFSADYYCWF